MGTSGLAKNSHGWNSKKGKVGKKKTGAFRHDPPRSFLLSSHRE
jgi:hypothetical protein